MTAPRQRRHETRAALDLVEEAVQLLRQSPGALAAHCAGALPFAAGLLYFWADMSRGAYADRRCAVEALALAALYVWMKTWHSIFSGSLRARLTGEPPPKWMWRRLARVAIIQAAIQPTSFITLPIAAVLTVPLVWTYAFYQNLTIVADDESGAIRPTAAKAWRLAWLWTSQNHFAITATWFFGLFVFLNILIGLWLLPHLLKIFLGIETVFTHGSSWMFSSTTFAAAAVLAWLAISPLTRAIHVLRCFYGESLRSGQDLLGELRSLATTATVALLLFVAAPVHAETTPPPPPTVAAAELDRNIERVLQQSRYTWRFPREHAPKTDQHGWFTQLARDISSAIKGWLRSLRAQARDFLKWLDDRFGRKPRDRAFERDINWTQSVRGLLIVLIALVAGLLLVLLWREWRRRRHHTEAGLLADDAKTVPDVADENVAADQLPEDDWLARARELCAAGEFRLALRAMYLAMLAHLGRRELITIARHKSNREYERELTRRARAQADLLAAFSDNRLLFEDAWYGLHEVDTGNLNDFQTNLERIRHDAATR
ncbi:MAG: DUF4129 domain-containing protein [Verrucomicrobia bacterium]|nr:DUF4129 domain-containing protein [Verrucomicrobiota bacterium]